MMARLDPLGFPHIFEAIVAQATWKAQLAVRQVSFAARDIVDRLLSGPELTLMTDIKGRLRPAARRHDGAPYRVIPFFHYQASLKPQYAAIRRADKVVISIRKASGRLARLLEHIQPHCTVVFDHCDPLMLDIHIPPCAVLTVKLRSGCFCIPSLYHSSVAFTHAASSVCLHFEDNVESYLIDCYVYGRSRRICPVVAACFNSGVRNITLGGDTDVLKRLLGKAKLKVKPGLKITIAKKSFWQE